MDGVLIQLKVFFFVCGPLLLAWIADGIWGDPVRFPHLIVLFGKIISKCEKVLNRGKFRFLRGLFLSLFLIIITYLLTYQLILFVGKISVWIGFFIQSLFIFYCLAGTTLIREVRSVFMALDRSLDEGRNQVARIVGRDVSELSDQEVRKAALETLAENLSDGVIAPLFWLFLLGIPGMVAYKMINTLDSMIGYRTVRYRSFGCFAARMDDIANWIPARITSILMILISGRWNLFRFVWRNGRRHLSPNSGYPEAALAGILGCRFGGPHVYFGEIIDKPYIGENETFLTSKDMIKAIHINRDVEMVTVVVFVLLKALLILL